jgi:serine/threonine protein kinase
MRFFRTKLHKEYLLNGKIDSAEIATLGDRLDYAWKVYNSLEKKYTLQHKIEALKFLRRSLGIAENQSATLTIEQLRALMALRESRRDKGDDYLPHVSNFRPSLTLTSYSSPPPASGLAPVAASTRPTLSTAPSPLESSLIEHGSIRLSDSSSLITALEINEIDLRTLTDKKASLLSAMTPAPVAPRIRRLTDKAPSPIVVENTTHAEKETTLNKLSKKIACITEVKEIISLINQLIAQYNEAREKETRITLLKAIYDHQKNISLNYPIEFISECPSYYQAIYVKLFQDLKKQFQALGFPSLDEEKIKSTAQTSTSNAMNFAAEIVANMDPVKLAALLKLLQENNAPSLAALNALYEEETSDEANAFRRFFLTHSIEFLGGSNSRNFLITSREDRSTCILKLENRFGQSKDAESSLRSSSLQSLLTKIRASRTCAYTNTEGKIIARHIVITDYLPKKSLDKYYKSIENPETRLVSAIHIYSQMSVILKKLTENRYAFIDMKNSNWLLDEAGQLVVADTKSFLYTNERGDVDYSTPGNKWHSTTCSPYITPKEYSTTHPFSSEKLMVYVLGKNLYQFLTQCPGAYLNEKDEGALLDFSHPIFFSSLGIKLSELIKLMIQPNPADRPSLDLILNRWCAYLKEHSRSILRKIKRYSLGEIDITMTHFIREKEAQLVFATTIEQVNAIEQELERTLSAVTQNTDIERIRNIISGLRREAGFFTWGMNAKASRIERALIEIPLEERASISTGATPAVKKLREALASPRYLGDARSVGLETAVEELAF